MMGNVTVGNETKNFDFVDTIRCIAMMGIVFEHSVHNGTYIFNDFSFKHLLYICLGQLGKFGTISFFVLAGFLLGSKFTTYSSWEYFKRRLKVIFVPWVIWSLIYILCCLIQQKVQQRNNFNLTAEVVDRFKVTYLYTNYWFIINFLFCIGLLLIFKKYLYSWWLGGVLFIFTAIYNVNVYTEWFLPSHTIAIFGFVFYLWLGAMANKYWLVIESVIKKTPYIIIISIALLTYLWSVFDVVHLIKVKSVDPYNTLRISNSFYSIAVLILLFKIKNFKFVNYLKPRETTFGIYLIHYIFVVILLPEVYRPFHLPLVQDMTSLGMIFFVVSRFVVVYGSAMLVIYLISKTKLKWIIGR